MKKISLVTLATLFLVLVVIFLMTRGEVNKCEVCAIPGKAAISPSGMYKLEIVAGDADGGSGKFNQFRITKNNSSREVVYTSEDKFYTRHETWFLWNTGDQVWVYSGDVGTFYWNKSDETGWKKFTYRKGVIPAPDFLKKIRPEYHI